MMKLDDLIVSIQARLRESKQSVAVSPDDIREILIQAKIVELLEKEASISSPKRLLVNRILLQGFKGTDEQGLRTDAFTYSRKFSSGINVWIGDNDTGKSTILKCILWALTGKQPNLKGDIRNWLTEIAVEFQIEDQSYLVQFNVESQDPMGHIYADTLEALQKNEQLRPLTAFSGKKVMENAVADLFGSQLGFSELTWVKSSSSSINLREYSIQWGLYSQAMFIGDDEHSDYLFPRKNLNGRHHQKTLGLYLGLDLLNAVSAAQVEKDRARHDYLFSKESAKRNTSRVRNSIETLEKQQYEIDDKLACIEQGQSVFTNETHLQELSQRVAEYARLVEALTNQCVELETEYREITSTLNNAQRSQQMLVETLKFKVFLNNLQIEVCPRCENEISAKMTDEEEITSRSCRLCHSEITTAAPSESHNDLIEDLRSKIKDYRKAQRTIKKRLDSARKELDLAHENHQKEAASFADMSRQIQAGFSTEMIALLNQRGYIMGRLEELRAQTEKGQQDQIKQAELKMMILGTAHKQLQRIMSGQHKDLLRTLEQQVKRMALHFGVKLEDVRFNDQLEMFVTQHDKGVMFDDLTANEQLRVKLAFHLALLWQRVQLQTGRHPALLIIDAPASKELDEASFEGIVNGFAKTQSLLQNKVQILLATTDVTLASASTPELTEDKRGKTFF